MTAIYHPRPTRLPGQLGPLEATSEPHPEAASVNRLFRMVSSQLSVAGELSLPFDQLQGGHVTNPVVSI